jgi:hypothetical protein
MKLLFLITFVLLKVFNSFSQNLQTIEHCKCIDKVDVASPELQGNYERICKKKIIEKGSYNKGVKTGEWLSYSSKGQLIRRINYLDGKLNGNSEFYYPSGKIKLKASFINNYKQGVWQYFTEEGKIYLEGEYSQNKPINTWIIKDLKGSEILVKYDFTTSTYEVDKKIEYHKSWDIIQNDNNGLYSIMLYPDRENTEGTYPLGGYLFANDLLMELIQVPIDFWDTYLAIGYQLTVNIEKDNAYTISAKEIKPEEVNDDRDIFTYILKTNDAKKLDRVEHSDLSKQLLEQKINETLNFMPPWIYKGNSSIQIRMPFILNQIKNIEEVLK